ncbi:hypothetical protein KUTeg_005940 [Tegillarca granosa]|uniref:Tetraspanin n=1 Tax=Tegillarca granosa TaxID=220873 RepID=A0ABQ9FIC3_TEGGR|nr:hypothetical protein KUTeg_005940 [Tegillarca granosa]
MIYCLRSPYIFTLLVLILAQIIGFSLIMEKDAYKCCGVDSYKDFNSSSQWNGTLSSTSGVSLNVDMPLVCCKTFPSNWTAAGVACATATSTDNNKNTGCYDAIYDLVLGNTTLVVLVFLAAIGIQIVLMLFAYFIIRSNSQVSQAV